MVIRNIRYASVVLAALLALSGCDKKASQATVAQARAVQVSAMRASNLGESVQGRVVAAEGHSDSAVQEAMQNLHDTNNIILYGTNRLVAGLEKKARLSEEAVLQIREAVETIRSNRQIAQALRERIIPKTPDDSAAVTVWQTEIGLALDQLLDDASRMAALAEADVARDKK